MSIARRLLLASVVLSLLVSAAFATLLLANSELSKATEREARASDVTAATLRLEKLVVDLETGLRGLVLTGNDRFLQPYVSARRELPGRLDEFEELVERDPLQQARARRLAVLIREYVRDYLEPLVAIARENRSAANTPIATREGRMRTDEIRGLFGRFLADEEQAAAAGTRAAERRSQRAAIAGAAAVVASILLIGLCGIYLARSIGRPVRAVALGASEIAGGRLALRLPEDGPGEVGELTRSFNAMAERLEASRAELERQNARLRESERLKTDLLSTVSHELRTPLASVMGFISLLLQRDFDAETRRHYLGIVDAQARRLEAIVSDFLDVQLIETGRMEMAEELVDVAALLRGQLELYAAQSPEHTLDLELPEGANDGPLLPVRGDPNRLAQVIGNLLSNAIKYSPGGGDVEVRGEHEEDAVRISVRDDGIGIPPAQHGRIFTKFFRGDAGASGIGGAGLGLAFSREVVAAHGGRIGFDSAAGRGSTFWVVLPAADAAHDGKGRNGDERKERQ
jgi:signal transduction histidine kinase